MFGSFFFPNKVANCLFKMGWTPKGLPIDNLYFSKMCDALKANGYDADRAANLWDRAFNMDLEASQYRPLRN